MTGAAGFVGRHVLASLADRLPDAEVFALDLRPSTGRAETVICDLLDRDGTVRILAEVDPDVVIHLAGAVEAPSLEALLETNVLTTHSLLSAIASAAPDCRVVSLGSAAEYGPVAATALPVTEDAPIRPSSDYGFAKACQSMLVLSRAERGTHACVARVFNLIGPGMPPSLFVGSVCAQLSAARVAGGGVVDVGGLDARRDIVDVTDAAAAVVRLAVDGRSGVAYNVCTGRSVRMREVLDALVAASGVEVEVRIDAALSRSPDVSEMRGSFEVLARDTGWEPRVRLEESARLALAVDGSR